MVQAYSMEGFEIRIDGKMLEMRTEGTRTAGMGQDAGRSFQSFLENSEIECILFDVRGAQYAFTELEWHERARLLARLCQAIPTAFVIRPDQDALAAHVIELLEARGGTGMTSRSRQAARDWLQGVSAGT